MAEYIEKEALKALVKKYFKIAIDANMNSLDTVDTVYAICRLIDSAEKADIAPVVHGKWIFKSRWHDSIDENLCSECGQLLTTAAEKKMNFCPNCGARMDLGGADNG